MKKLMLIAFLSLFLFSIAFAVIDTSRPGVMMVPRSIILDVSCFLNDARVSSTVSVIEIDSAGSAISGTGKSLWSGDGRVSFRLTPAKSYRVTANRGGGGGRIADSNTSASKDITNFEHSTAIGLVLEREGLERAPR